MQEHICKQCGKSLMDYPGNKRVYCSRHCAVDAKRTARPKCKICDSPVRLMRNQYCSRSCRNKDLGFQSAPVRTYSGLYAKIRKLYPNPEPCVICGVMGEHRHHPDYTKPFDVVWVCSPCHRKLHQTGKRGKGGGRQRPGEGNTFPVHTESVEG